MLKVFRLLPIALLPACAALQPVAPPPPAPPPAPVFVVPEGTEFVSTLFGYSQAVRVGPWITTSAIPGFDIEKRAFPKDFEDQVAAAFELLEAVLKAAGASMDDVTEITTYQLDMEQFFKTVDARNEAFGEHRPTWTPVGVTGMPLKAMQFQISARAYVPLADSVGSTVNAVVPRSPMAPAKEKEAGEKSEKMAPFLRRPGY